MAAQVCPSCGSAEIFYRKVKQLYLCETCDAEFVNPKDASGKRKVFLSYGHDGYDGLALRLKADLEARGHEVWFDLDRLVPGADWEHYIEEGLAWVSSGEPSGRFILMMTPHSVRRRDGYGYCLNELAYGISRGLRIVPVMVASTEPPLSIFHIQWLDMRDCIPLDKHEQQYRTKLERLGDALEKDQLDFDGRQSWLLRILKPLQYEADTHRHLIRFTGRQWLMQLIDQWLAKPNAPRIFAVIGAPGVGKSAIASWLCQHRAVAAIHVCRDQDQDKSDPKRCVLSIAAQLASQLPAYYERLVKLNLDEIVSQNVPTVFARLLVEPLSIDFPRPQNPVLILVDALDEATHNRTNELARDFVSEFERLPAWMRMIVTCRPDDEVMQWLNGIVEPCELHADGKDNEDDLREYVRREFGGFASDGKVPDKVVESVLSRSEGYFLYVEWVREELARGHLSLDRLDEFPQGLSGVYARFFRRQFPSADLYAEKARPILELILVAREPIGRGLIERLTGDSRYDLVEKLRLLGSLVVDHDSRIRFFHRSVAEWLTDEKRAGIYFVSAEEGHKRLGAVGWDAYRGSPEFLASVYFPRHTPHHLILCGRRQDAETYLSDLTLFEEMWAKGWRFEWMRHWKLAGGGAAAAKAYETAVRQREANGLPLETVAGLCDHLGWFMREMGYPEQALPFSEKSLEIRKDLGDAGPQDRLAESAHNLGQLYRETKEFERAGTLYETAHEIWKKLYGENSLEIARSHHDMAEFYHDQKRHDEAIDRYRRSLELRERILNPFDPAIADCLNDMGTAMYETSRADEALPYYTKALRIYERAYGRDHPDVAAALFNIALIHVDQSRVDEAFEYCYRALDILESTFPVHHNKVRRCSEGLLQICRSGISRFPNKVQFVRGAVRAVANLGGSNSAEYASALNQYVRIAQDSGLHEEAIPAGRLALKIRMHLRLSDEEIATSMNNLGISLICRTEFVEEGESYLLQAVQRNPAMPNPHYWLAKLYQQRGDTASEIPAWRKYLELEPPLESRKEEALTRLKELLGGADGQAAVVN